MNDIKELIAALSGTKANVTINIYQGADSATPTDVVEDDALDTDFEVGDYVWVCHTAKDGSGPRHTKGTVDSIGTDSYGPFVRVTGDNGKHYKCGLKMNEERKGSKIFDFVD